MTTSCLVSLTCCPLPEPDAIVVAPATFNTLNKWVAGIADTLALGLLCEAIGKGLAVVVLPYLNAAQAEHPALAEGIDRLRKSGVRVLSGPDAAFLNRYARWPRSPHDLGTVLAVQCCPREFGSSVGRVGGCHPVYGDAWGWKS